ncbi:CPBP family intramembrane glutamic endopeptidase [uncultured Brevibacillus sp.]|uniref:CPBP family intramembrane glutamic endopeptidase n=1 Tax=uncultured Brevibacillus sp. TaxID=169970 RepID=UPI0025978C94|nr:CPBP family intramembrane glutamic endopeptidase [uncultured Brevibacillus sp.]
MKYGGQEIDEATLRLNLWLTQGLVLIVAAGSSFWVHGIQGTMELFRFPLWSGLTWSGCVIAAIVLLSIVMDKYLPKHWQDDGSVNMRIFGSMSPVTTLLVCIVVGVGEEWLFRGVIQSFAGNFWTSLLFTLVHVRYVTKPLMVISVFGTSWLLGMLFTYSGSLWSPIVAHIGIDLLLAFYLQAIMKKEKGEKK